MSANPKRPTVGPQSRNEIAGRINKALKLSDVAAICQAVGDATRLHNISDIAKQAGIERPSVYRAFAGKGTPNLSTFLNVLNAMGLQLKVMQHRGQRARKVRIRSLRNA